MLLILWSSYVLTSNLIVHIDGWLEDSWCAASHDNTDGKHNDVQQSKSIHPME